jgi:uncharacterized membrane protein YhaH (DUF805 family)
MDWQKLFLTFDGRLKRQDFWIGWLIIFAANIVIGLIPLVGQLFHLFSIYVLVCLTTKRLHDMGRSGLLQIIPYAVWFVCLIIGFALFGSAMISAIMAAGGNAGAGAMALLLGSMGGFMLVMGFSGIVGLAFLVWVGATPGQAGENQYGPDPLGASAIEVF